LAEQQQAGTSSWTLSGESRPQLSSESPQASSAGEKNSSSPSNTLLIVLLICIGVLLLMLATGRLSGISGKGTAQETTFPDAYAAKIAATEDVNFSEA